MKVYVVMRGKKWKIQSLDNVFLSESYAQQYIDEIIKGQLEHGLYKYYKKYEDFRQGWDIYPMDIVDCNINQLTKSFVEKDKSGFMTIDVNH